MRSGWSKDDYNATKRSFKRWGSDGKSERGGEPDRDHGRPSPCFLIQSLSAFLSAPDYENPTDAGGDNGYEVTVRASDGVLYDEQTITVTVTDAFENTSPSNVLTVAENEDWNVVASFNATDDAGQPLRRTNAYRHESNASTYAIRVEARDERSKQTLRRPMTSPKIRMRERPNSESGCTVSLRGNASDMSGNGNDLSGVGGR